MLGRPLDLDLPGQGAAAGRRARRALASAGSRAAGGHEDISFEIRAGEIVGLAGLIGSGRTEVARAIFGADRRERRRRRARRRAARRPLAARRRSATGVVDAARGPQAPGAADAALDRRERRRCRTSATSRPPGVMDRRSEQRERRRADRPARRARRARTLRAVNTLSGGNQQKVLFAKWLFRRPRVFIAGRADARRRRRRQARDLRADPLARGRGHGGPAHLLGARGGARPRAPRARDARRADRRRVRPADDERGGGAARRLRDRRRGRQRDATRRVERRRRRAPSCAGSTSRAIRDYGVVVAFVALFITLSISSDVFLTTAEHEESRLPDRAGRDHRRRRHARLHRRRLRPLGRRDLGLRRASPPPRPSTRPAPASGRR